MTILDLTKILNLALWAWFNIWFGPIWPICIFSYNPHIGGPKHTKTPIFSFLVANELILDTTFYICIYFLRKNLAKIKLKGLYIILHRIIYMSMKFCI